MDIRTTAAAALCGLGMFGGLLVSAPSALADTNDPAPVAPAAPTEVPHLSSLDNLPPGTTGDQGQSESRGMTYLHELWQAVQTQDVSLKDAMLLLAQRPMDPSGAGSPGMPLNPVPPPGSPPASPPPQ
jgi:hypothetical protein